ncbi:proteasome subunit beta type-2 [Anabrus simplex]|uniref:proteasome subunit beta type-2 n=1 Tax=Anabrus simplex TaxID=316456 RepID=UPI0034DCE175
MESLLGIACKDFVIVAADMMNIHSIMVMKDDEDKIYKVADRLIMGVCGEAGDTTQYAEYIAKNMQLYKMRNGYELSPYAAANFTRGNLAEYLRTRSPYNVNMLLAGYSDEKGPQLYFLDYLASMHEMRFTSHGYGGMFSLSIMDRYYKRDMTVEEGYELLKKCVREIKKRFVVNLPNFTVKLVDKDGVKVLPPITQKDLVLEDAKKSEGEK